MNSAPFKLSCRLVLLNRLMLVLIVAGLIIGIAINNSVLNFAALALFCATLIVNGWHGYHQSHLVIYRHVIIWGFILLFIFALGWIIAKTDYLPAGTGQALMVTGSLAFVISQLVLRRKR